MKFLKKILLWLVSFYVLGIILLYFEQEKIIFHPKVLAKNYKFKFDDPFDEIYLKTKDHKKINALYFKTQQAKGAMLIFHGNSGNLQSCGNEASKYIPMGYDVLIPDFRSFGKSDRNISEQNLLLDALLAFDYLIQKGWKPEQITIYGRSLGTGMASYTAAKRKHKQLILYTPYYSMKKLAAEKYPFVPGFILAYPLESHRYLKNLKGDIFLFHGTNDNTIPLSHSKELKKLIGSNAQLTVIEGGKHNNLDDYILFKSKMKSILTH